MTSSPSRHASFFEARFYRSSVPQLVVDPAARLELVNDALCAFLGQEPDGLVGRPASDLLDPSDPGDSAGSLHDLLAGTADSLTTQRVLRHATGRPLPVLVSSSAVREPDGRISGASAHLQDLTVLRDAERRLEQQQYFFHALGERSRDAALVADDTGRLVYVSPVVRSMLGHDPEDIVDLEGWDFIHPDDVEEVRRVFGRVVAEGGTDTRTFRVRTADGQWRWVEESLTNFLHTPIGGVVCNLVDVTEQKLEQAAHALSEARHRTLVQSAQEGVWIIDRDGRTDYVNPAMGRILGLPVQLLEEGGSADALLGDDLLETLVHHRFPVGREEYDVTYAHPAGGERVLRVVVAPIAFGGEFSGLVVMASDVTELRNVEAELRDAALRDGLTGLPNRALLADRLDQALLQSTSTGTAVKVLVVDVDGLRQVNETRGHDVGDAAIVAVARRLQELVPPTDTLARLGGDNFLVLTTGEGSEGLPDRVVAAFDEPLDVAGGRLRVTVSAGAAASPPHEGQELLRRADRALRAAKAAGGAQARRYDEALAIESERELEVVPALRRALSGDELVLHYQPIIDLGTGAVSMFEALVRWPQPDGTLLPPSVFVPLAEGAGLAAALDTWVVQRALRDFAELRRRHLVADAVRMAVNLSAARLTDGALERDLVAAALAAGLAPRHVALEITETAMARDLGAATEVLGRLAKRGFSIELDDFGTGYSSLAYLRSFPVNTLKIDRSFVSDMTDDTDALAIVTSIVRMAQSVGVRTVAEGVETIEQARLLRKIGCDAAQGWLWSKAVPLEELQDLPRRFAATPVSATVPWTPQKGNELRKEHGLQLLLDLQHQGASPTTIAAALNQQGFTTPDGRKWNKLSVVRALSELAL